MIDGMYNHPKDGEGQFTQALPPSLVEGTQGNGYYEAKIAEMSKTIENLQKQMSKMDKTVKLLYESLKRYDHVTKDFQNQLDSKIDRDGWRNF